MVSIPIPYTTSPFFLNTRWLSQLAGSSVPSARCNHRCHHCSKTGPTQTLHHRRNSGSPIQLLAELNLAYLATTVHHSNHVARNSMLVQQGASSGINTHSLHYRLPTTSYDASRACRKTTYSGRVFHWITAIGLNVLLKKLSYFGSRDYSTTN